MHLLRAATLALVAVLAVSLVSCRAGWRGPDRDFRGDMRAFVVSIAVEARAADADFIIIPQNGHELLTEDGLPGGAPVAVYVAALSGVGHEDLFYGYEGDGLPTPADVREGMLAFLDLAEGLGVEVLVTDYTDLEADAQSSYEANSLHGFISFAAPSRGLDVIPDAAPRGAHTGDVTALSGAANFLYLLDPSLFEGRAAYLAALEATDYDVLIVDLFFDGEALDVAEVVGLRTKASGGSRLVIAYLSIGEAEDYRYYWDPAWRLLPPGWLAGPNSDWPGNHKVEYWDPEWQALILGGSQTYLGRILAAGFDGVYLDIIDAYEYFEEALGR